MKKTVFDFKNYKKYLEEKTKSMPNQGRGIKGQLADFIRCQRPFVSQVLNGRWDFSLEQAQAISKFFHHSKEEDHFFLLLIQFARAGNKELKAYFQEQMQEIIMKRKLLKNRLKDSGKLSLEDQETYYSSWYFQAIHVMVDIKKLRTKEAIASYLNLPIAKVAEILEILCHIGVLEQKGDQYLVGKKTIFLEKDSILVNKIHSNWRLRAMHALDNKRAHDMHYSSCISISTKDAIELRELLFNFVESMRKKVKDTKPEQVYSICLDLFRV